MGITFATLFLTAAVAAPSPTPDDPPILLPSGRAGNADLFVIDPVKGDTKNLTQTTDAEELYPAWSPDGKRVAFMCKTRDHDFEIYVCDADGSNRKRLTGPSDAPGACLNPTWSADGKWVAYTRATMPGGKTGKTEARAVAADGSDDRQLLADAHAPAWSPDGKRLAFVRTTPDQPFALCTAAADGTDATVLVPDLGHNFHCLPTWSPDGKLIAYAGETAYGLQLFVVPAAGGSPRQLTHLPGFNLHPVWLSADKLLFSHCLQVGPAGGGYAVIHVDGSRLAAHPLSKMEPPQSLIRPAVFLPRAKAIADVEPSPVRRASYTEPVAAKRPAVKVTPVVMVPPSAPGAIVGAAWAADGKRLALAHELGLVAVVDFDGKSVRPVEVFRGHQGAVECVGLSPDGSVAFSGGADKTVRTWDVGLKGSKGIESDHNAGVATLAVSADGKLLATGDQGGVLRLRSAADGKTVKEVAVCDAKKGGVHAVAFGANDAVVFAGCARWDVPFLSGRVAAFDAATGKELWRTTGTCGGVLALAVSPDGAKLAGACLDTFVRVWDAKTGAELACWKGHSDRVTGVAWGLGGKVVVSCGFDHTVRVWDAASGAALHVLAAHPAPAVRVAATADGRHVVSTGRDGAVFVWKLEE